jgi:hypothetical protein
VLHEASPTRTEGLANRKLFHAAIVQDEPHPAYQKYDKQMTIEVLKKMYASLHGNFPAH